MVLASTTTINIRLTKTTTTHPHTYKRSGRYKLVGESDANTL